MVDQRIQQAGTVLAYEPYSEIRQLIGNDVVLSDVFTEDKIQACANLIRIARDTFFEITATELNMLERLALAPVVAPEEGASFLSGIAAHATNIKGQAEILGFTLIARICSQISQASHAANYGHDMQRMLIAKMVETLRLAYKQKITDEGGAVGKEILQQLERILSERR